jgi:tRNA A-37 threonylcarbamoyl transferase component Bud32
MERGQDTGMAAGDVLAGKYRVDRVLGQGGMGVVVAAHHLQLDERVAIKFLLPEMLANPEATMRFSREARAAVKIKSEHVARVTDVGVLDNGAPYMVMEYLEGSDLAAVVARGALPVEQAVDFLLQACEAIAEAHALGIVHRDLKPANLFLARLPGGIESVKVLDFGISKAASLSGSGGQDSATRTKALMGSPLYMSPEQMQSSRDVDARSDLWALGIILYELLGGSSPFIADTMPELILKIMSTDPAPLRSRRSDVAEGLEAAIMKCLVRDRRARYQTVGELAAALAPYGSRKARHSLERISQVLGAAGMASGLGNPAQVSLSPPASAVGAGTAGAFGTSVAKTQGAHPLVVVALTVLVLALGAGAYAVFRLSQRPAGGDAKETLPPSTIESNSVTASVVPAPPAPEVVAKHPPTAAPSATVSPEPVASVVQGAASANAPNPAGASAASKHFQRPTPKTATRADAPTPVPAAVAAPAPAAAKKPSASSLIDERF